MTNINLSKLEEEIRRIRKALTGTIRFQNDHMINVLKIITGIDNGTINNICIYTIKDYEYTERRYVRVDSFSDKWRFQLTHNPEERFIEDECDTIDVELIQSSIYEFAAWANNPILNGDCVILYG